MRRFNNINVWVYRNLSCHQAWHERSYQIAFKQGNQNPQHNVNPSFSFASTAHVPQWSNYLTKRAETLTRGSKFNASTGEEYCEWFVSCLVNPGVTPIYGLYRYVPRGNGYGFFKNDIFSDPFVTVFMVWSLDIVAKLYYFILDEVWNPPIKRWFFLNLMYP